jgi:hypothetical protein
MSDLKVSPAALKLIEKAIMESMEENTSKLLGALRRIKVGGDRALILGSDEECRIALKCCVDIASEALAAKRE